MFASGRNNTQIVNQQIIYANGNGPFINTEAITYS
jgi:hypothetical protein